MPMGIRSKDREFYEGRYGPMAFREGRRVLSEDGVGSVVFAHKTTEGWEALTFVIMIQMVEWTITERIVTLAHCY